MAKMNNQFNPDATDVIEIYFRRGMEECKIKTVDLRREDAVWIYETIAEDPSVTFACAFVKGGDRL